MVAEYEIVGNPYSIGSPGRQPFLSMMLAQNNGMTSLFERYNKGWQGQMSGMFNNANVAMANNPGDMEYLSERFEEQTSIFRRITGWGQGELPGLLTKDSAKTVNLVLYQGAKTGDPTDAIKKVENFWNILASGQNNKNLEHLADAVIETRNSKAAALMVFESADGFGANTPILDKLFIESKSKMSEVEYNKFIRETAEDFKTITNGENMTDFLKKEYSLFGIKLADRWVRSKGLEYAKIIDGAYNKHQHSSNGAGIMPMMVPGMRGPGIYGMAGMYRMGHY